MSDDGHTPGPPKQLLAGTAAHVGHIRVVYRKAEDPGRRHQSRDRESEAPLPAGLAPLEDPRWKQHGTALSALYPIRPTRPSLELSLDLQRSGALVLQNTRAGFLYENACSVHSQALALGSRHIAGAPWTFPIRMSE